MQEIPPKAGKNKTSKRPYMRLFTSDYRDGTAQLDFELQGFYFRILTYLHDGETVPADASELARFLQCNARTVRKLLPKLVSAGKLFRDGFELKNPRIERELELNSTPIQPEFDANSDAKIQKPELNQEPENAHHGADHFQCHSHIQKEDIATIQPIAARDEEGRQELKQVFNGSTEAMIADVVAWMAPLGNRNDAIKWLTGTLAAFGPSRTAQAWTIVNAKRTQGEPVGNPLALWAKTARGISENSNQAKQSAKVAGAAAARATLERMMGAPA